MSLESQLRAEIAKADARLKKAHQTAETAVVRVDRLILLLRDKGIIDEADVRRIALGKR